MTIPITPLLTVFTESIGHHFCSEAGMLFAAAKPIRVEATPIPGSHCAA